jgi:LemA protein
MPDVVSILVVLVLAALLVPVFVYNGLVGMRNRVRNAFSQIEVQLKRRHDLIPNLVGLAKGYMAHESQTLEAVIQARNQAVTATSAAAANPSAAGAVKALAGAETALNASLGRLLAVSEAYPDLRSSANMLQLGEELTSTENKVAFARQAYNDAVMHYNTRCQSFPAVLVSRALGFIPAESFELANLEHHQVPQIDLGSGKPGLPG